MYLSLVSSDTFEKVAVFDFPHFDKIIHFGMYFGLMMCLMFENRITIKGLRSQLLLGIIPLVYGILIEFIQSLLTVTRSGEFFDAIFDFIGIVIALSAWRIYFNLKKVQN